MSNALRVPQTLFALAQELRCLDLLGNVLNCTHHTNGCALAVPDGFGNGTDKTHFAIRSDNAEFRMQGCNAGKHSLVAFQDRCTILGVNQIKKGPKVRSSVFWYAEDPKGLIRPLEAVGP